jgi:GT2 family glycosyltransferase
MTAPIAGVAVVHHGDPEPTLRCLETLAADSSSVDRRVALVDNMGNIAPDDLARGIRLLKRPDNPGFGRAANFAIEAVDDDHRCSLYLVLNHDVEVAEGFFDSAAGALEVGVGAVGGPIHVPKKPPQLWYGGGGVNFLTGTVRQLRWAGAAQRRRDVGFIPATAMAISPVAWREIGGFDPRFFLYNEDVDLCLRLRRAGWRLVFEPLMACEHRIGAATGSNERTPLYLENLTRTRLLPFKSRPYRLYLAAVHTLYNVMRIAGLGLRHGLQSGPYIRAVARGHARGLAEALSVWR